MNMKNVEKKIKHNFNYCYNYVNRRTRQFVCKSRYAVVL